MSKARTAITETVSKKRGRPQTVEDWEIAIVKASTHGNVSDRTIRNNVYEMRAVSTLYFKCGASQFDHFLPSQADIDSGQGKLPCVLLTELGQLNDHEMVEIAKEICDRKLSTKDAVQFVRSYRCKRKPLKEFSSAEFFSCLNLAMQGYAKTHECSWIKLFNTVDSFRDAVLEKLSENAIGKGGAE